MKKKITYATIAVVAIATAFLIGRNMPSKYNYLNLNQVTSVTQNGNNITIYTDTDCYKFTITK